MWWKTRVFVDERQVAQDSPVIFLDLDWKWKSQLGVQRQRDGLPHPAAGLVDEGHEIVELLAFDPGEHPIDGLLAELCVVDRRRVLHTYPGILTVRDGLLVPGISVRVVVLNDHAQDFANPTLWAPM